MASHPCLKSRNKPINIIKIQPKVTVQSYPEHKHVVSLHEAAISLSLLMSRLHILKLKALFKTGENI